MTLAADIQDDYLSIDGIETVAVTPQSPISAAVGSVAGLRGPTDFSDFAQGFTAADVVWNLWTASLGSTVPQPNDLITAGAEVFTILSVSKRTLGTRYRCVTRKRVS